MRKSRVVSQGREYMREGREREERGRESRGRRTWREDLGMVGTRQKEPRRRKSTLSGNIQNTGLSWVKVAFGKPKGKLLRVYRTRRLHSGTMWKLRVLQQRKHLTI